jgi:signal transduction histidine kinase
MIQSFRLRLALLSALSSGLVLAAFGLGNWWLIRSIKIDRLAGDVRVAAEREVGRAGRGAQWSNDVGRIAAELGLRDAQDLVVLVEQADGEVVHRSASWPAIWASTSLPWPDPLLVPQQSMLHFSLISNAQAAEAGAQGEVLGFPDGRPPRPFNDRAPPDQRLHPHPPLHHPGEPSPPPPRLTEPHEQATPVAPDALQASPGVDKPVEPMPFRPRPVSSSARRTLDGTVWYLGLASTRFSKLAFAANSRAVDADMNGIRNAILLVFPFAMALVGLASWLFAHRALRPVNRLIEATRKVTAEGLGQRLAATGEDREFVALIEVFNRMLGRLERSFQQAHRFTADAAHELKTPLAIVQGQLERAIGNSQDGSNMQASLTSVLDEVRRLSVISRKLLLLSQADAGRLNLFREDVDLSALLEGLLEDTRMLAPLLRIEGDIQAELKLRADQTLLLQVLHNLVSNAIKYNVEGGWIRITTARWAQHVEVVVANASQGIPNAARGRIFERFFRADPAHSRHIEGVGLGLSVSREIARAHGGDLTLKSDASGAVQFALLLPL